MVMLRQFMPFWIVVIREGELFSVSDVLYVVLCALYSSILSAR